MKRKAAIFLCLIALGLETESCESPEQVFEERCDWVKASVDPEELRSWATKLIEQREANPKFQDVIPQNEILPSLRDPRVHVVFHKANEQEKSYVTLQWGGGFGHWGILVGDPEFRPFRLERIRYVEWEPGIYFWTQ